ncbi:CsgG/HfaB family protein [Sphingomonas sp.]|uniref:CsgG/HfaB family protein n=1 Tax=Sphingomonas sp. TaxID=28214 RepID=UPI002ED7B0F0
MLKSPAVAFTALALCVSGPAAAQRLAKPSSGQKLQEATMTDVPRCTRKLGTLSVVDGDDPRPWTQYSLASPQKLLKVLVQRSGCFNLVDRGSGLQAAERERQIGGHLGLQRGSNVGQGQIKAADYVMVAEIQGANSNVSGSAAGGLIGGLVGGRLGGLAAGLRSKKMEANTLLSITNVRTTETIATTEGYAAKNNLAFGGGGAVGIFGGGLGAVGGGYDNTDIGRIVTLSFIQAYTKLVTELGLVRPGDEGTAQAAPAKTFTAQRPVALRATAAAGGKLIRTLPAGATVYPTGNKNGLWWEVADENDNVGWVLNTGLAPSQH